MITAIFLKVFNMCLSAGYLAAAVLIIRLLLYRAPKWIRPVLWGIVGLRLIFPFSIESMFSLIPSAEVVSEDIATTATPSVHSGINAVDSTLNPAITANFAPVPENSANPMQIVIAIATAIWLMGMAAMLLYAVLSFIKLKLRVRTAVLIESTSTDGKVFRSEYVSSPFVLGFFSPKIYLPSSLPMEPSRLVILHEAAHIARKDNWWKAIGFLLLSIYWFNPLLWVSYVMLGRDIESAYDERVIKKLTPMERAEYSQALLALSSPRRITAACPLAYGETSVKSRVKQILAYKKPAFWLTIVAVAACIAIALCFLTVPNRGLDSSMDLVFPNSLGGDVRVEYTLPEGLAVMDYDEVKLKVGPAGGILLLPNAYELVTDSEDIPKEWLAAGMIALYYTDGLIEWDGDEISTVWEFYNHTINEPVGPLNDLSAPAYLMKENHDLYTAAGLTELENGGTDLSKIDISSAYWCVYFARPGEGYGIVVSLNAKNYSKDDVISFAHSITYEQIEGQSSEGRNALSEDEDTEETLMTEVQQDTLSPLPDGAYRFDLPDIDGNGINDYIMRMDGDEHSDLEVYLNEDMIYENREFLPFDIYADASCLVDLDRDGEKELFFIVEPHVNSMPMVEYYVLKKQGSTWSRLEYYQEELGGGSLTNAFPINFEYDDERKTVHFLCGGLEAENVLNLSKYVERLDREAAGCSLFLKQNGNGTVMAITAVLSAGWMTIGSTLKQGFNAGLCDDTTFYLV